MESTLTVCKQISAALIVGVMFGIAPALDAQQSPAPAAGAQDPVAALKQSVQQGMALSRKYEWIETTIVSMKGEEKSRKQRRCYYGADGKVQKVPLDQAAPPAQAQAQPQGGRRGRRGGGNVKEQIVENKKDEMQDYMASAVALIHSYVPPSPAQIQAAKDAGRVEA